ncbi:hypothetical protein N9N24_01805 [Candidatus Marinimicrobia bacterium]|nr:hypothetical protein [Candidatus Neomarinimicrobiota bacterium]
MSESKIVIFFNLKIKFKINIREIWLNIKIKINDKTNNLETLHISENEIDITIKSNDMSDDQNIKRRVNITG